MHFALTHAQNSGGIGGAILTHIIHKLPDATLNEIIITRDNELEKMFGIRVEEGENNEILPYLTILIGMLFGEMNIRFAKDVESYFNKHKITLIG